MWFWLQLEFGMSQNLTSADSVPRSEIAVEAGRGPGIYASMSALGITPRAAANARTVLASAGMRQRCRRAIVSRAIPDLAASSG
jgi:hypothetical protein